MPDSYVPIMIEGSTGQSAPGGNYGKANPIDGCPLTATIAATGGKWKLLMISWLGEAPRCFGELRRLMPATISHKVLTEQLRELAADDIVRREATGSVPAPVSYSLTDHGRTLVPIVAAMRGWGRSHIRRFE
jgi:DNA-binding HxlR family transcriptional regulator